MSRQTDKVIVTNGAALRAKYSRTGLKKIRESVATMMAKDEARGLTVRLIAVDNKTQMNSVNGPDVTDPTDEKLVKRAIDAIAKALRPHYILILGAPDVIPHQTLEDQTRHDVAIPSDLPYACKAAYSTKPSKFLNPTRVVGRLPGLVGSSRYTYLTKLIRTAANWTSKRPEKYAGFFGLTAKAWIGSTRQSLTNTFGGHAGLHSSPPTNGSNWTEAQLAPLSHFINCHGAEVDPSFYGDPGNYPVAHAAVKIRDKLKRATVATAECCYGAQLYDPSLAVHMGICSTYLDRSAYAFFGSTTIAYGPAVGNGYADLITQYFLKNVLAGMSTGRAALEARLTYIAASTHADPIAEKTLAQFTLLGDPSIHPVRSPVTTVPMGAAPTAPAKALPHGQGGRRLRLERIGKSLGSTLGTVLRKAKARVRKRVKVALDGLLAELDLDVDRITTFDVTMPKAAQALQKGLTKGKKAAAPVMRYYLVDTPGKAPPAPAQPQAKSAAARPKDGSARQAMQGPVRQEFLLLQEVDGEMVEYQRLYRR